VPPRTSALVLARSVELNENITINSCAEVNLLGGHAPGFTVIDDQTTIAGLVTVACGTLVVDGVSIR